MRRHSKPNWTWCRDVSVNCFSISRVAKLFGDLPSEWHTLNSSRLTVRQYLDIFTIGQLKIEWPAILLLLEFFRFQMEINELRNGVYLKDPFTAYGSLYGNLNAIMTSAKNNCFRSCTSGGGGGGTLVPVWWLKFVCYSTHFFNGFQSRHLKWSGTPNLRGPTKGYNEWV